MHTYQRASSKIEIEADVISSKCDAGDVELYIDRFCSSEFAINDLLGPMK